MKLKLAVLAVVVTAYLWRDTFDPGRGELFSITLQMHGMLLVARRTALSIAQPTLQCRLHPGKFNKVQMKD